IKAAKYAMLLSDALVLLVPAERTEDKSSARDRETNFGGGNAFQQKVVSPAVKKPNKQDGAEKAKEKKKAEVCFRLVKCIPLKDAQLRLRPTSHSFVLVDKGGLSHEIAFLPAQKMDWITAWANIEGMEHSRAHSGHS